MTLDKMSLIATLSTNDSQHQDTIVIMLSVMASHNTTHTNDIQQNIVITTFSINHSQHNDTQRKHQVSFCNVSLLRVSLC